MNALAWVFSVKIVLTIVVWCVPLLMLPTSLLREWGFTTMAAVLVVRLLGWAYLVLCIGYAFGLRAARNGRRLVGPIWVGIVSNGGACGYLVYFGVLGAFTTWPSWLQVLAWGSALGAGLIMFGLLVFGVRGRQAMPA